jgi:hypothetical protein
MKIAIIIKKVLILVISPFPLPFWSPHPAIMAGPVGSVSLFKQATQTGWTVSSNSRSWPNFEIQKKKLLIPEFCRRILQTRVGSNDFINLILSWNIIFIFRKKRGNLCTHKHNDIFRLIKIRVCTLQIPVCKTHITVRKFFLLE